MTNSLREGSRTWAPGSWGETCSGRFAVPGPTRRGGANGRDVRIGGGPNTIQQYLRAGLIDELHIAVSPVLLGQGERLFEEVDARALGYECVQFVAGEKATHVVLRRQGAKVA